MSVNTDQLIASLSQGAVAVKPVRPWSLAARWVASFTLYSGVLVAITGVRPDLATAFTHPLFALEILFLGLLIISSALTAGLLSFPDRYQRPYLLWLPLPLALGFAGVLAAAWGTSPPDLSPPDHGMECLSCITFYSLLPGAWLFFQMRKLATTHGALSGMAAVVASFSMAALTLRLKEQTDSMHHLVFWHYLPMLGMAVLGLILGKRLLKW